jgi:hypothetical protein
MKYLVVFLFPIYLLAQPAPQLQHRYKAFVDSAGNYYQQASMPVYLFVANSVDGKLMPLKTETNSEVKLEGHGMHALKHLNSVTNKDDVFRIYADGIAPLTSSLFTTAVSFSDGKTQFYGNGLMAELKSNDEMSGVEGTYYSINGESFQLARPYKFSSEGKHSFRYYSVDKTGNVEKLEEKLFVVDLKPPVTYHNVISISSENVISTNSSIYLTAADTLSGISKTYYRFDKENYRIYAGGNISFQYLADGDHVLSYYSVDNVLNKEEEHTLKVYLDKTAPIMSADVLGDKFIVGDRVYFSGRTKLKLTAVDNKSGIKDIMYSINNESSIKYEEPFYLPNRSGIHNIEFYSVDQTNNTSKDDVEHSVGVIYLDLTGPTLTHTLQGASFVKADTVMVSPKTQILLSATDPESGLKKISFNLDNEVSENLYESKPINIKFSGLHKFNYYGYDNVNNRNAKSTLFYVDEIGPEINAQFTVAPNKEGKYPSYTNIYLSATDSEVGAGEIRFKISNGKEQIYGVPLKGFTKNQSYTIKIIAYDLLGNSTEKEVKFNTDRY